ncbi:phenylalanine--tRNA ligase subunit beta [Patescibacteria group bacterium]|nr:MAG: phenylalanine--tRNA ligase subunit beta [Patescibacteria group bacterium]
MNISVSYNWLKEFLRCKLPSEEFARRLSESGMGVERIERLGESLEQIVAATVAEVRPHPNADRLRIALVDAGKEVFEVVCGGVNLKAGIKVAFAKVGARVRWHGQGELIELKPAEIRGAKSFGMICAASEIGLQNFFPHAEREILDLSWLNAPNGTPLKQALGLDDQIFDIEVTTNRPDALSVIGLAREAAVILKTPFLWKPPSRPKKRAVSVFLSVSVAVAVRPFCPRYQAIVLDGVKVAPSPWWLQLRLLSAGIRPISNIVDITNYVMLEFGQPLHAFDYDRLEGKKIEVRTARAGEKIRALDGRDYELKPEMLVIADAKKPVAIAGVMGGEHSAVAEKTTRIVFESANFAPVSVRRTSRSLNLQSDSSLRFEKGLSTEGTAPAFLRAIELAEKIAGGKAAGKMADVRRGPYKPLTFDFDQVKTEEVIGVPVKTAEMKRILLALGFTLKKKGKIFSATVPWWRDHDIEDSRDLTEEVARVVGYHTLPSVLPAGVPPLRPPVPQLVLVDRLKTLLADAGATEIYSYSFVSEKMLEAVRVKGLAPIRLANPLSADFVAMRTNLAASMLEVAAQNQMERPAAAYFEVAKVYLPRGKGELPEERLDLIVACIGESADGREYYRVKGYLERLTAEWNIHLGLERPEDGERLFHPGRAAKILFNGEGAGAIGEIDAVVSRRFGLERRAALFTIPVDAILRAARPRAYRPIPAFPPVKRDVSFIVGVRKTYEEITTLLKGVTPLLTDYSLFDIYQGKGVPAGKKSLAFHLIFSAPDRTLAAQEADAALEKIIGQLKGKLGAEARR